MYQHFIAPPHTHTHLHPPTTHTHTHTHTHLQPTPPPTPLHTHTHTHLHPPTIHTNTYSPLLHPPRYTHTHLHTPHRLIDSPREQIRDAVAVYFVLPNRENIAKICQDCKAQLYDNYYFNFITPISRSLLEDLAKAAVESNCVAQISKVYCWECPGGGTKTV